MNQNESLVPIRFGIISVGRSDTLISKIVQQNSFVCAFENLDRVCCVWTFLLLTVHHCFSCARCHFECAVMHSEQQKRSKIHHSPCRALFSHILLTILWHILIFIESTVPYMQRLKEVSVVQLLDITSICAYMWQYLIYHTLSRQTRFPFRAEKMIMWWNCPLFELCEKVLVATTTFHIVRKMDNFITWSFFQL